MDWRLFKSTGTLHYGTGNAGLKLIVDVDSEISSFYRSLVPKYYNIKKPLYKSHISVVRKIAPPNMSRWGEYEGECVTFYYDGMIQFNQTYFWINIFSLQLEKIRLELGLSIEEHYITPPIPFLKTFHMTIGNLKRR